jgi:hypothetical protein
MKAIWSGYKNPYYRHAAKCPKCDGGGYSPEYKHLEAKWYGNAPFKPEENGSVPYMPTDKVIVDHITRKVSRNSSQWPGTGERKVEIEAARMCEHYNTRWCYHIAQEDVDVLVEKGRLSDLVKHLGRTPTAKEVNEWSLDGFGHDSSNAWYCIKARLAKASLPDLCGDCDGDGNIWDSDENRLKAEGWSREEPPTGGGFQLWETTTEGSPASPVFATLRELCTWCADNATTFGTSKATADQWEAMLSEGFVAHREGNMVFI